MKHSILLLFICLINFSSYGQGVISISSIPDSLKQNANAVYILNEGYYEIIENDKAVYKVHQIIAILNSKASWMAAKTIGYDKLIKINYLKGSIYDQSGNLIRKLKKSELIDQSSYDGFSVYTDNRLKHADLRQGNYPFFVEFDFEIEYKYTYSIPDWQVLPRQNVSVMKSKYSIKAPIEYKPYIKIENTDKLFTETSQNNIVLLEIEFNNLKAQEREKYGPEFSELTPSIYCSPSNFDYDGYKGDMSTWDNFGKWQLELNSGRDDISDKTKMEVIELTKNLITKEEKIKAVYEYVQNKTRYVSIQLGIGGFQPFPASEVDYLGYGDCKALSNYTYSLLKSIDIPSNYTLVYGGDNPPKVDRNFPDDTFNHIILCVPNEQDTIWLECTSQTNPFGYVGDFTGDRDVLVVNDFGGKIVHTPVYDKNNNVKIGKAVVELNSEEKPSASVSIKYSGLQTENNNLLFLINNTEKKQKQWIYDNLNLSDFEILKFDFKIEKNKIPVITESLDVVINNFFTTKGDMLYFTPNLLSKWKDAPKRYTTRQTDIVKKIEWIDIDTIIYNIPKKYSVEYIPDLIYIQTEFGIYNSSITYEEGILIYTRKLEMNKGRFSKDKYYEFRKFYKDIIKADKSKVVFINKS